MPEDPAGVVAIDAVVVSRDGLSYGYSYARLTPSDPDFLLLRGRLLRLHRLEIELSVAFGKEHAFRGLVAARRVSVVPAGLHQVRTRPQPEFGFAFRCLNVFARHDHELYGVGMRMEWSCESRRETDERAVPALRMVTPHIRDLDSRSTGGVEVGPLQLAGRHDDGSACPRFRGALRLRLSGSLRQYRLRQHECH